MTYAETKAPDGSELPLTHLRVATGRGYRIVTDARDLETGRPVLILANEAGVLFTIDSVAFYSGAFTYVPGGQ